MKDYKIYDRKKFMNFAGIITNYSVEEDKFIREIWCNKKVANYLTEGKKYKLYAEFETGAMITGKCYVVLCDNKNFMGFDSDYFLEEFQWIANKKYNV